MVAQSVGTGSQAPEGSKFNSWTGHIWEATDGFLLLLFLCSLSPLHSPLSLNISSGEDKKKKTEGISESQNSLFPLPFFK